MIWLWNNDKMTSPMSCIVIFVVGCNGLKDSIFFFGLIFVVFLLVITDIYAPFESEHVRFSLYSESLCEFCEGIDCNRCTLKVCVVAFAGWGCL